MTVIDETARRILSSSSEERESLDSSSSSSSSSSRDRAVGGEGGRSLDSLSLVEAIERKFPGLFSRTIQEVSRAFLYRKYANIIILASDVVAFSVNSLYQLSKELGYSIHYKTIAKILESLYEDGFLDLQVIETGLNNPANVYYVPSDPRAKEKLERIRYRLEQNAKKTKQKKKDKEKDPFKNSYLAWKKQSEAAKKLREERKQQDLPSSSKVISNRKRRRYRCNECSRFFGGNVKLFSCPYCGSKNISEVLE